MLKKLSRISVVFVIVYFLPSVLFSDDIKEANKLYQELSYKYALEIYQKIMVSSPSSEVAQRIANCYRFINKSEEAEIWYKKVLGYDNVSSDNYRLLAEALKQNGKFDEAATNFLIWGEKNPDKLKLAEQYAEHCNIAKDWAENPDLGATIKNEAALNTENSDFSPINLGEKIVFVSDRWADDKKTDKVYGWTGNPYMKMYEVSLGKGQASQLKGSISGGFHSGPAALNASSDTLIFTRAVATANKKKYAGISGKQHLLFAVLEKGEWKVKDKLPFNSDSKFSVQHPALSPNGNILYFASDMPGGFGGMDLYYSEKQANGTWSAPKNCGDAINTPEDDVFPTVRKDGKFYFSSRGHVGMGGLDIFSATGEKATFAEVTNLRAPLNSTKDDFGILYNEDLKTGFLSSNRTGGLGLDDIYNFKQGVKAPVKPKSLIYAVNGAAVEKGTGIPITGLEITLLNKDTQQEVKVLTDEFGKFKFELAPETDYWISGDQNQYFTGQTGNISTKGLKQATIFDIKFELERAKDVYTFKLDNIYYDFDKWNIRPDAVDGLNKVNQFLKNMSNVRLELVAHTDARGRASYNMELSDKRANSARDFLIEKGVLASRLAASGKGETELLNKCGNKADCTEEEHQLNRRTEFKIVKITPVIAMN
jgi:outer membrane protein OmpA-like peptidoglycan-associated protein/tetratricopeptide (TPR) repeat protein